MQAVVEAAPLKHPPGAHVNDLDFTVSHNVVAVADEQLFGLKGVLHHPDPSPELRPVEVIHSQLRLDDVDAGVKQRNHIELVIELVVVVGHQLLDECRE